MKPHILRLFYYREKQPLQTANGVWAGLALCRSIIEAHDGTLVLSDHAPHGCNFTFTLPLSEVTLNE